MSLTFILSGELIVSQTLPQLHQFDTILNPTTIPTRYPNELKRRRGREKTTAEIQEAAQAIDPATGRQRGSTRGGRKTHTQAKEAERGEPAQVVNDAVTALQRQQRLQVLGSLAARGKGKSKAVVLVPSDENDELANTIDLTSEALTIQPRLLSDLLDVLLETSERTAAAAAATIATATARQAAARSVSIRSLILTIGMNLARFGQAPNDLISRATRSISMNSDRIARRF